MIEDSDNLEYCLKRELKLESALASARALLFEAVEKYPVEQNEKLWTVRVRAWLEK